MDPSTAQADRRGARSVDAPLPPQRMLVAGGAGFIGSHLCARLLDEGHDVLCVDDFSSGSRDAIAPLERHPRFGVLRHDVTLPLDVDADAIFNLACPASPRHYQRDPVRTTRTCVEGAIHLLALATRLRIAILQASTSEVYGDPLEHPQREDYAGHVNPIGPRACYDEGKRCAETLFMDHRRRHGTSIKIARIFNTYGPHMQADDGRVVSNFIVQALSGRPLTVYGDGSQTRSLCFVGDTVEALLRLMRTPDDVTGPVNIGNPREIAMLELARLVLDITHARSPIRHAPLPQDDPRRRCPDIARARRLLGWEPSIGLEAGLAETATWFERVLQRHPAPV